jgi:hypothetical protein
VQDFFKRQAQDVQSPCEGLSAESVVQLAGQLAKRHFGLAADELLDLIGVRQLLRRPWR